jgi:hypothetical protein
MGKDISMDEKPPIPPTDPPSLLAQMPPTDPLVFQASDERRAEMRHYAAIGRVAANWSYLEADIDTESISLAGLDGKMGICFTAQIAGSGRKLDAYIALARLQGASPKLIQDLCDFAKDTQTLSIKRNRTVHDVWFFNHPQSPQRLEASAGKVARLEYIPTSTEKLLKLADEIDESRVRFDGLALRVQVERRTSLEKSDKEPPS